MEQYGSSSVHNTTAAPIGQNSASQACWDNGYALGYKDGFAKGKTSKDSAYRMALIAISIFWLVLYMWSCPPSHVRNAYVSPNGPCGYVVMLGGGFGVGFARDVQISNCLSLPEATALTQKLNTDMNSKWPEYPNKN